MRFSALRPRERIMIAITVAATMLIGGYSLWIEPARLQQKQLQNRLAQQQEERNRLLEQVATLTARSQDPDAANRAALQALQKELDLTGHEIAGYGNTLIAPDQMPELLQKLLARHRGLQLLGMKTLPPRPLVEMPTTSKGATPVEENLYQHGIEIKLAGSYQDLLAYVAELDASPQKLLRGKISLAVRRYPVSELTLTVYSLSLDPRWLVV
ncbi:MAG: type II secretion system protein GspM [Rhodocyclaceae bacterium]